MDVWSASAGYRIDHPHFLHPLLMNSVRQSMTPALVSNIQLQASLKVCVCMQDELLHAASQLVRPGGLLVYSTCSIEPEENERKVHCFLERHSGFAAEAAPAGLLPDAVLSEEGFIATLPHVHGIDGIFGARLRRVS